MVCARCGANVADGFKFCPECGAAQPLPAPKPAADEPTAAIPAAIAEPTGKVEVTPRQLPVTPPPAVAAPQATETPATTAVTRTTVQQVQVWPDGTPRAQVEEVRFVPVEPPPDPVPPIVLAVVTAIAAMCAVLLRLYTLRTDQQSLQLAYKDIATNSVGAAIAGCLVIVAGAALAASNRPVGAGLMGGAGLSLAALASMPLSGIDSVYRLFTRHLLGSGTFTHEAAFFSALATAGLGIILFLASIGYATSEGATHPAVRGAGVIGLLGTLAVVLGPLLPMHDAKFADNFTGDNGQTLSLLIRTGGIVLILLAGVVGFLNNSTWGLGVGLGGIATWAFLWFTAQFEMGSNPVGPAGQNPGARDTKPHAITTVGVLVVLLAALAGIAIALAERRAYRVEVRRTNSLVN